MYTFQLVASPQEGIRSEFDNYSSKTGKSEEYGISRKTCMVSFEIGNKANYLGAWVLMD